MKYIYFGIIRYKIRVWRDIEENVPMWCVSTNIGVIVLKSTRFLPFRYKFQNSQTPLTVIPMICRNKYKLTISFCILSADLVSFIAYEPIASPYVLWFLWHLIDLLLLSCIDVRMVNDLMEIQFYRS